MFDKNKETRDSVNEAAKSAGEAAEEGKELIKETRQDINKVKAHFARNKNRYLIGGGIVVGTVVIGGTGFAIGTHFRRPIEVLIENNNAPVFNNNNIGNSVSNVINNGGPARKIVGCVETGQLWRSMGEAARAQGKSLQMMSNHIHDRGVESINGLHFYIDAVTAD